MTPLHRPAGAFFLLASALIPLALAQSACELIAGLKSEMPAADRPPPTPDAPSGDTPVLIAEEQAQPRAIAAADEKYVFWSNEGDQTLWRMNLDTAGPPELVVSTAPNIIRSLALDLDDLYWTASPPPLDDTACYYGRVTVGRAPKVAPSNSAIPDPGMLDIRWSTYACKQIGDLFVDGTNLYWPTPGDGRVYQMSKGVKDAPRSRDNQGTPTSIWADELNAYWNNHDDDRIVATEIVNFQETRDFTRTLNPTALVGDATHIYWITDGGAVFKQPKETPDAGALMSTLADKQGLITSLAIDDKHVYFTAPGAGQIRRVGLAGGEVEVVVAEQNDPQRVVLDKTRLFWTTYAGGRVFWMKKP